MVKKAYEKTILSAHMNNNQLEIFGITDELEDQPGELKLRLLNFDGTVLKEQIIKTTLNKNTSTRLYLSAEIMTGSDTTNTLLSMGVLPEKSAGC